MRKRFSKTALTAGFVLAMAFAFGCSSDDDEKKDNGGGGGGSSDVPAGYTFLGGCDQRSRLPRCINYYSDSNYDYFKNASQEMCDKDLWLPNGCPNDWFGKCALNMTGWIHTIYFYDKEKFDSFSENETMYNCVKK